jgi:hypothetical protein
MPTNRKLLGAAAFSLALAGGGVAGALLGTPSLSGAQDETEDTTEATAPDHGPRFGGHRGQSLEVAAEALGITTEELRTALEEGQSIAQVAEADGVDVQLVIDALVADATARLEDAIDELPDRMAELVEREGLPDWGRPGRPGDGHWGRGLGLEAAAEAIGISTDELRAALQDGSSLAEVAAAHDVDAQVVVDALVAEVTARLDEAVANGRLTEAEAEERAAAIEERISARVNGEGFERPVDDASA